MNGDWLLNVHGFSSWQNLVTGGDRWLCESGSHCSRASSVKSSGSSQQWMIIIRGTILEAGTEDTSITPLLFFSLCLLTDLGMPHYHRLSTLTLICLSWVLSKTLVQLCVTVAANPLVKAFGEFGTVLMIRKCLFMYCRHYANNEVKYNTWKAHALFHYLISFILFFSLFSTAVLHKHL